VKKRIIILLDGTWNDADKGSADTNIVRLREQIATYLYSSRETKQRDRITTGPTALQTILMTRRDGHGTLNVVFYERGVGTGGFFNRFSGGAFGAGLASTFVGPTCFCLETTNLEMRYTFLAFREAHTRHGPLPV
jgi:uncharacterized protein (DUF2235 family)